MLNSGKPHGVAQNIQPKLSLKALDYELMVATVMQPAHRNRRHKALPHPDGKRPTPGNQLGSLGPEPVKAVATHQLACLHPLA